MISRATMNLKQPVIELDGGPIRTPTQCPLWVKSRHLRRKRRCVENKALGLWRSQGPSKGTDLHIEGDEAGPCSTLKCFQDAVVTVSTAALFSGGSQARRSIASATSFHIL